MAEGNKDIVLSIRGMSKSFGRNKVLKHIDMDVPRGSIMGLMGENGAVMKRFFGKVISSPMCPSFQRPYWKNIWE